MLKSYRKSVFSRAWRVVIEVLLQTPRGRLAADRLFDERRSLAAPHLVDVEVAQVLRRYARAGELSARRGKDALQDFVDMPIERYPHDLLLLRVWQLRNNLTAYDAVYVALAEVLDATLLTTDRRLADSTTHAARIELI